MIQTIKDILIASEIDDDIKDLENHWSVAVYGDVSLDQLNRLQEATGSPRIVVYSESGHRLEISIRKP